MKVSKTIQGVVTKIAGLNTIAFAKSAEACRMFVASVLLPVWNDTPKGETGEKEFRVIVAELYDRCGFTANGTAMKIRISEWCKVLRTYDGKAVIAKVDAIVKESTGKGRAGKTALTALREIAAGVPKQSKDAKRGKAKGNGKKKTTVARTGKLKSGKPVPSASDVIGHADTSKHPVMAILAVPYDHLIATGKDAKTADWASTELRALATRFVDRAKQIDDQRGTSVQGGTVTTRDARKAKARAQRDAEKAMSATM